MATRLSTHHWQETLDILYTLEEPEAIRAFLDVHPKLIDILIDAHEQIIRSFGTTTTIRIRYYVDPDDSTEDSDSLGIIIASPHDVDVALHALHQFDDGWWLDQIMHADGRLTFDIDFR